MNFALLLGLATYMSEGHGSKVIRGVQFECKSLIRVTTVEEDDKEGDDWEGEAWGEDGESKEEPNNEDNER